MQKSKRKKVEMLKSGRVEKLKGRKVEEKVESKKK